jgi:hypothetical protein
MPILPRYKVPAGLLATKLLLEWQQIACLIALMITEESKQKTSKKIEGINPDILQKFILISQLIKKEFLLEFRQKSTLAGILVYIVATVFISALCFQTVIQPAVWNALFWVIFMFGSG